MAILKDIKFFQGGSMNSDDAIEYRPKNDYFPAYNIRTTGTESLEEGYITNIESNASVAASVLPGISLCIGSAGFESARIGLEFIYNSASHNTINSINYDTNEITEIDIHFWPLNPQHYVNDIKLVNNDFLLFNDNFNPPAYCNYNRLLAGQITSYNQLLLIHRQPSVIPTAIFGNDPSRNINNFNNRFFQFRSEYVFQDYEQSAYGSISALSIPAESATPEGTTDVTVNNNQTIQFDAGDSTVKQIVLAARENENTNLWKSILTIDRSTLASLPLTVNIPIQQYLAYDPVTNLISFVFYNDGLYVNIPALITDQLYDNVPQQAGALEIVNGNQVMLGDITTGYDRPNTPVSLNSTNYNPNLTSPTGNTFPMSRTIINSGQSGSGEGNHKRLVVIEFGGVVRQGDFVTIILVDIRNSSNILTYNFAACSFAESGDTRTYIIDNAPTIPNTSVYFPTDNNSIGINIITPPYFTLQSCSITYFNAGSGFFKSIHALKGNSSYQVALAHYDYWGRPFPIQTDPTYIVKTNSYAQAHGLTSEINWALLAENAPVGAYTYQWLLSKNNTHLQWLDVMVSVLNYNGTWDAHTNMTTIRGGGSGSPAALTPNQSGAGYDIGTVYEISTPNLTTDTSLNLGNGVQTYNTGDYVVNNGTYWFILPASYGNLVTTTDYYFYFNSLNAFNVKNNSSILSYDFTEGDRCTVYYSQTPGVGNPPTWYDGTVQPIIDLQVQSYDAANFLLRVNGLPSVPPSNLAGLDILVEVYTPQKQSQSLTEIAFFETGQVYNIVNGQYQTLTGVITQGDNYFKTREVSGSIDPNTLYTILVEDPNYTDFFPSKFYSYGRPRTYSDIMGRVEQIACINYSQLYVVGSQVNGLTTFYAANIYGQSGGQTSANFGNIIKLIQINNELVCIQKLNHGSIPVYISIIEDQAEQQNVAISEFILNNIRYTQGKHIGIGNGVRSVAVYNNIIYWIDENRNEPVRWAGDGCIPISGKMSKYFRQTLQAAYAAGFQPIGWYDIYNDEYVISIPQPGGIVMNIAFSPANWQYQSQFSVLPADITIITNPLHSSPSYNDITGIVVVTPSTNYVGNDSFQFSFPGSPSVRTACYNWITGSGSVNAFYFTPLTGAPLSTLEQSNTISVTGNDYPVPISITGDPGFAYSVNGGAFTSSPGIVNNGDIVQVEVTSSGSLNTGTSCTLTIDGQSASYIVTTTGAGHLTASARYGITIIDISNGSATIAPSAPGTINLVPNNSHAYVYSTISGGTINVTISGEPGVIPGHVALFLEVAGVVVDQQTIIGSKSLYQLNLGSMATDPTLVVIGIATF